MENAGITYGIEVKSPALLAHIRERGTNPTQVPARVFDAEMLAALPKAQDGVTRPRDNPVKDFLKSADAKFASFKAQSPSFIGLLVIVWDDFVFEPISSLLHKASGLFTSNSFYKDDQGRPIIFPNVDGVAVIRHVHQIMRATRSEQLIDECRHALDYGEDGVLPWKAFIANPHGQPVPEVVLRCLQARPPSAEMGAEYAPSDLIWWLGNENS